MKIQKTEDVLRYSPTRRSRSVVRRHYARWRAQQGIPNRCDVQACCFHTKPLKWLGKTLPLTLDHVSGNRGIVMLQKLFASWRKRESILLRMIDGAHDIGMKVHVGMRAAGWTIFEPYTDYWETPFYLQHQNWRCIDRDGTVVTPLELGRCRKYASI